MTEPTAEEHRESVWEFLGNARVRAWFCLVRSHRTVEWRGDVAHCAHGTCELTSEDTAPWLRDMAEAIAKAEAERDAMAQTHADLLSRHRQAQRERDAALADVDRLREHDHICGEILTANEDLGEALTVARADIDRLRGLCREQSEWLRCTGQILPVGDHSTGGNAGPCGTCLPCRIRAEAAR